MFFSVWLILDKQWIHVSGKWLFLFYILQSEAVKVIFNKERFWCSCCEVILHKQKYAAAALKFFGGTYLLSLEGFFSLMVSPGRSLTGSCWSSFRHKNKKNELVSLLSLFFNLDSSAIQIILFLARKCKKRLLEYFL